MTYFPVTYLRSVDLATPDITRSEAFYVANWGLDVAERQNGIVNLRGTGPIIIWLPFIAAEIRAR